MTVFSSSGLLSAVYSLFFLSLRLDQLLLTCFWLLFVTLFAVFGRVDLPSACVELVCEAFSLFHGGPKEEKLAVTGQPNWFLRVCRRFSLVSDCFTDMIDLNLTV